LPVSQAAVPLLSPVPTIQEKVLAERALDLETRAESDYVNEVFKFNILLALDYFDYGFTLEPGKVFAFHEKVLAEFKDEPLKISRTHYTLKEGYKVVSGLPGNGVCHLATLMNWVATEGGLEVTAKVNHNFAPVPGVPLEYGTSIRFMPDGSGNSANQNLYIKNTLGFPVKFVFKTESDLVKLKITR
jgi:hypothetical protein